MHLPRDGTEVHQHARGCHRLGLTKPEAFLLELSRVTVPLAVGDPSFLARLDMEPRPGPARDGGALATAAYLPSGANVVGLA